MRTHTISHGRELDVLDNGSLKIMYYRARYYDPQTGRFMQRDPLEYVESPNIYEYVLSCPIGLLDPYGERSITYEANFPQTPAGFSAYFRVAISVSDCPVRN
jgi:RHS repeat-associated protein